MDARVRYYCWDKRGMTSAEWWERRTYIIRCNCNTFIISPTGQVLQKECGEPSGTMSTTDDNCIFHLIILCYGWKVCTRASLYKSYGRDFTGGIYGDDHLFGIARDSGFLSLKIRQAIYNMFGARLSVEKDSVTDDPVGHTFLGYKCEVVDGNYVPTFDTTKILNACEKSDRRYTPEILVQRVVSYMFLSVYSPLHDGQDVFTLLRHYALSLKETYGLVGVVIPTRSEAQAYWLGTE